MGALPDTEAGVTGLTAAWIDSKNEVKSQLPAVFAFVLLFAFVLMLFAFRSLVVAAKAIVLNLLSVAAAYGVLVLVFQHGVGKGFLGFSSTAGIDPVIPAAPLRDPVRPLDGLPRVHPQPHPRGVQPRDGKRRGDRVRDPHHRWCGDQRRDRDGFVFAIFATLSMMFFKQFGVGLAVAVLLDATIVRAVLLPASMKLLGDWNWYLPSWLEWLPNLDEDTERPPETAPISI